MGIVAILVFYTVLDKIKTTLTFLESKVKEFKYMQNHHVKEIGDIKEDVFNLEKYIKQQFAELHQFLLDKEEQLIQQLKNDEANTLKRMEGNLECIKQEIVTYLVTDSDGNLVDKIKEEDSLKIMEENVKSVENDAVAINSISHSNMEIIQPEPVLTEDVFNLERYIKQQFAELHQFLLDKEQQLIQQLKNDEANTLKWMEGSLECIKQEIVTYLVTDSDGNLEDKIKEEDSLKIMEENVKSVENYAVAIKGVSHSNMEIRQPEPVGLLTVPETFEDVTVTFSEEEWKILRKQDKELYRDVMVQNYETCVSVGYKIPPEKLLQLFKADEVPKDIVTGINIRKQKDHFEETFNSMKSTDCNVNCRQQPTLVRSQLHDPTRNLQQRSQPGKDIDEVYVTHVPQLPSEHQCHQTPECDNGTPVAHHLI
ncbi:neurotrophin receptor-interacting factor 2-like [Protopterus annectens]|uniref:neurotrophin receptor-interacting factor 2-like n=1 Tax=Protopterus annectens TaxID=7888 RepID=UPI001CF984B3|nr:neurotrophin receptor-interacting factor 2-like [Protopterus annectens]